MHNLPAKAEFIHSARMQILYEYVTFFDKFGENFLTIGCRGIKSKRFLVRIQLEKIVARTIRIKLKFFTGCIS